jgi:uncharacterized protein (DUF1330 family)
VNDFGGTVLAKGPGELVESANGGSDGSAVMLIEFESIAKAAEFYHSEAYQAAKKIRDDGGADVTIMMIEGAAPPALSGYM